MSQIQSNSTHTNTPLPLSATASQSHQTMTNAASHPYATTNVISQPLHQPQTVNKINNNPKQQQQNQQQPSRTTHTHSTHPPTAIHVTSFSTTSINDRKAHEATKAQKIKEYFGIAANISDWDFEALQEDIRNLGESLLKETDAESVPSSPVSPLMRVPVLTPSSAHVLSPLAVSSSSAVQQKEGSSNGINSVGSDTETEDEIMTDDIDEEIRLLKNYENEEHMIAWRWHWLHLQTNEIQRAIKECEEEIIEKQKIKPSCIPPKEDIEKGSSRCVGWLPLPHSRELRPPTAQSLHIRLHHSFHPLFAKKPRVITTPVPEPDPSSLSTTEDIEPESSSRSSRSRSRKRTPSSRRTRKELTNSQKRRSLRRTADYDIDDVVLPMMGGTVQKIRKIEYKEIHTPSFREITETYAIETTTDKMKEDSSEDENTDDETYEKRHAPKEQDEKTRFAIPSPAVLQKRREKKREKRVSSTPERRKHRPIFTVGSTDAITDKIKVSPRKRTPSRKKKEMAMSMPDLEPALAPVSRNYRYPDSIYESSLTPTTSTAQTQPTHSHNTRRSARTSSTLVDTTTPNKKESNSKKKKKKTKRTKKKKKEKETQNSSTKIILRLPAQNTLVSSDDEVSTDDDSDPGSPSMLPFRPIFTIGKKRKRKTSTKWVIAKKTFEGPESSTYPEPFNNVIYIHKIM